MSKKEKRSIYGYSENDMTEALIHIRAGMAMREASRLFSVPRSTLQDRLSGRRPESARKMGPKTVLTTTEELSIVKWLVDLAKCGFARKPDELLRTVQKIVLSDGRTTPFTDGLPGRSW
jgi:hypothetical protein